MQPHATSPGLTESRRGCPGGTAVLSKVLSHSTFQSVPMELWETQRFVDSVVRIGALAIRVASVYGYPSNHPDALVKNQALFSMVLLPVKCRFWCVVTLIAMSQASLVGRDILRPTATSCTNFTTSVPKLRYQPRVRGPRIMTRQYFARLWQSSSVDVDSHMFDAHSPVHLWFRLPISRPATQAWRLPVSWSSFAPPKDRVEHFYIDLRSQQPASSCSSLDDLDQAFVRWAKTWERSVHLATKEAHMADPLSHPVPGLGRKYRGRCRRRDKKFVPVSTVPKPARQGDYNPTADPVTILARQKTRQVRRLETYLRNATTH